MYIYMNPFLFLGFLLAVFILCILRKIPVSKQC